MAKWTINDYNTQLDRSKTVIRMGRNHIIYEYVMPLNSNPYKFYEEAVDVRSHKNPNSKWPNGKKPGEYQPVGDKSYFTFYQLKAISKNKKQNELYTLEQTIEAKISEVFK